MHIDQYTHVYGIVGSPLGHSLSPAMHNAAFTAMNLNAVYVAFETPDIEACIKGMRALGIRGLSVTLPYKNAVLPLLDEVDEVAQRVGAVNTIVNERARLIGYNTDVTGARMTLEEQGGPVQKGCLIIGAGGAARAVGFTLVNKGLAVTLTSRSEARGRALAGLLGCSFVPFDQMEKSEADLLINTTPVGMAPRVDQSPVPEAVIQQGMTVMDMIYNPVETKLLCLARSRGCRTLSGLSMFIHQGAEQFRLWTGLKPPLMAMTDAVREALTYVRRS